MVKCITIDIIVMLGVKIEYERYSNYSWHLMSVVNEFMIKNFL